MLRVLLLSLLLIPSRPDQLAFGQAASPIPADAQTAMGELRKEPFRAHMAFLADDLLEGRGTGNRGHELAARYVAAQFEALGLKAAGQDGTYYQRVPLRKTNVEPDKCTIAITEIGSASQLKWGDDFVMRGNEPKPDASVEAPVVFVGYGARTPDGRYDDYASVDVKGKIVAFLGGAPPSLSSELGAHLSAMREKLRNARDHGAVGAILLWSPKIEKTFPWSSLVIDSGFPSMQWLGSDGLPNDSFPEIQVRAILSQLPRRDFFNTRPSHGPRCCEMRTHPSRRGLGYRSLRACG